MQDNTYMKEGQVQGSVSMVISLIVGVGVAVLVLIFVGVLGGQTYNIAQDEISDIADNTVTAESFTILNGTIVQLDHNFIQTGTLRICNNSAPQETFGLGNFTIDYDDGSVLLNEGLFDSGPVNASTLLANYTWGPVEIRQSIQNSILSSFEALEDTGDYLPLIVLGIIIFVVLGLVLGMTAFSGGTGSGGTAL